MADAHAPLGSGALWSMLDNLAQQVLSFLVFLVLARLLVPRDFGLLAIAHVLVSFFRQTVLDAIVHPVARAEVPTDTLYTWAFAACLLAALAMAALMWLAAQMLAQWYAQPDLAQVVSWMGLVVLATGAAAVYEVRLVRQMDFKPLAIRSIVSVTLGGTVGIVLAWRGGGIMALVWQQILSSGIALALLVAQSHWRPRGLRQAWRLHAVTPDAVRVGGTGFFGFLATQGDTVLVSLLMGAHATGLYSFAKRLTSAIYLVIGSSLLKLAIPAFAAAGGRPQLLRTAYIRILGTTLFLMAPLLVGLSVVAPSMIAVFFGAVWAPAAPVIGLLAVLYLLLGANQVNDYLLFAVGARTVPLQRALLQILLALLLGWWFARGGLTWIASGFVLAAALVWPWAQSRTNHYLHTGFADLARALKAPVLASLLMWIALQLIPQPLGATALGLVVAVAVGALVFVLAHICITRASPQSFDALRGSVR